jgi:hypothetical protein
MRVFVLQRHLHWDAGKQALVDKFDFTPAREYGEIHYLLSHNLSPFKPEVAIDVITKALDEVDFQEEDYLLLAGNPCFIAWTAALVADRTGGRLKLLQWHGKDQRYTLIDSCLWDENEEE